MRKRVLVVTLVVSLNAFAGGCSLNPQPEPPGSNDPTAGTAGVGGSSQGKGGTAANAAGAVGVGGSGAGGDQKGAGGSTAGSNPGKAGAAGASGKAGGGASTGVGGAAGTGTGPGAGGSSPGVGGSGVSAGAGGGMANGGGAGKGSSAGGAAGGSAFGGGGGASGAPPAVPAITALAPSVSAACKQCLDTMTGSPSAKPMLDCGTVASACGPQDQGCQATVACLANALMNHPAAKFDCAVASCQTPIAMESAANDFLACLGDKCGAACDATAGFADVAMCPP